MKTADLQDYLESVYPDRHELIPCLLGKPGIGKTQGIHEFALRHGVKVVTFILSHALPSEVSGIRMPDLESGELVVLDDAKMMSLEDGDVLFFDEFLEAPEQLWNAVLTLFQDRVMASGRKLPDVMIVAASNKTATAKQISEATRDRLWWIDLEFDYNNWCNWFNRTYGVTPVSQTRDLLFTEVGYNILTPRKFSKLYGYCNDNGWSKGCEKFVKDSFGSFVWDRLHATSLNVSAKQQLIDACLEIGGFAFPEGFEQMPIEELAELIMGDERWDEIAAELQKISLREEEACTF